MSLTKLSVEAGDRDSLIQHRVLSFYEKFITQTEKWKPTTCINRQNAANSTDIFIVTFPTICFVR